MRIYRADVTSYTESTDILALVMLAMVQHVFTNQDTPLLMSNMVTRCPKCATSFRITSAQLQSAKGSVRCGSCLHIFKAQEHLADRKTSAQAGMPTKTATPVAAKANPMSVAAAKTGQTPAAQGPADLATRKVSVNPNHSQASQGKSASSTKADSKPAIQTRTAQITAIPDKSAVSPTTATRAKPAASANKANPAQKNSPGVVPKKVEQKPAPKQNAVSRESSGDEDFLISDDMDDSPSKKEVGYEFGDLMELEKLPSLSISLFDREARKEEPEAADNADESWAMDLLDDADDDSKLASMKRDVERKEQNENDEEFEDYANNLQHDQDEPASNRTHFSGHIFSLVEEKPDSNAPPPEEIHAQPYSNSNLYQQAMSDRKEDSSMRAYDTSRVALLMNIMPEPVTMTSRRKGNWSRKKLWAGLSLLMLVLLLAQIAWLQFDNLNRSEPYRSAYAVVCPALGCKLPALIDRSKIRAYNLVVRNHPEVNDALIVDAIILNNATFQQPFPDLGLEFSTIDDKPIAVRRFTPKEYLGGELAGEHLMPPNQPVHLTLELVDPGPEAVNYHAYIPE